MRYSDVNQGTADTIRLSYIEGYWKQVGRKPRDTLKEKRHVHVPVTRWGKKAWRRGVLAKTSIRKFPTLPSTTHRSQGEKKKKECPRVYKVPACKQTRDQGDGATSRWGWGQSGKGDKSGSYKF